MKPKVANFESRIHFITKNLASAKIKPTARVALLLYCALEAIRYIEFKISLKANLN